MSNWLTFLIALVCCGVMISAIVGSVYAGNYVYTYEHYRKYENVIKLSFRQFIDMFYLYPKKWSFDMEAVFLSGTRIEGDSFEPIIPIYSKSGKFYTAIPNDLYFIQFTTYFGYLKFKHWLKNGKAIKEKEKQRQTQLDFIKAMQEDINKYNEDLVKDIAEVDKEVC